MGDSLHEQDARHHRIVGKVPLEERLVDGHALDADDRQVGTIVLGPVDQQKGVAMGDAARDLGVVDVLARLLGFSDHVCSAFPRPEAILASQADSRMNCLTGLAGDPAQRSPAGTLCITPAAAATMAPAPMVR